MRRRTGLCKAPSFSFVQSVTFGTSPASYTVVDSTTITAVSPSETPGVVDVQVTTVGGTSSIAPGDIHLHPEHLRPSFRGRHSPYRITLGHARPENSAHVMGHLAAKASLP